MKPFKLHVFDLDGTLAPSKSPIDDEMSVMLQNLLSVARVAIISGGAWHQFQIQVLKQMAKNSRFEWLSILPTCGTRFYTYRNEEWQQLYAENFTETEKNKIITRLQEAIKQANLGIEQTWGPQIEDRGSQITFSALGQKAPLSIKELWDPDLSKRTAVKKILDNALEGFLVSVGGSTSIDITKSGIDKGYGINKLHDILKIPIDEMCFVGDALFEGGNDFPVKRTGIQSFEVDNPSDTKNLIIKMIESHKKLNATGV